MAAVAPVRTLWKVHELVAAVACVRTLRGARSSLAAVTMCALEVKSSARGLSKPKRPQLEQLCIFIRYLASKYQVPKRQQQNNPRGPRNISHDSAKLVCGGPHRSLILACIKTPPVLTALAFERGPWEQSEFRLLRRGSRIREDPRSNKLPPDIIAKEK